MDETRSPRTDTSAHLADRATVANLLVDSTGLRLRGPGEWLIEKHGGRTRRSWKKLHLATDADTGRIVASLPTDKDADGPAPLERTPLIG